MGRRTPLTIERTLRKVGQDIEAARKRRRIPLELMAERVGVARNTYRKVEKGDPTVHWGTVAITLMVLQLMDRLRDLVDVAHDEVGLFADAERLPQRVRLPKRRKKEASEQ